MHSAYTIRYDHETGAIEFLSRIDPPQEGDLIVAPKDIPPEPQDGARHELVVRDGVLVWDTLPPEPDPEPPEPEKPTREAVRLARAEAYRADVDPLTAEIARLRDMAPDDPRIAEAEAERARIVARIVADNPYPDESV